MLFKAVLPIAAASVVMVSSVFAAEEQTSATMAADEFVADAYQLKVGDTLKYENSLKALMFGAPKESKIKADAEFTVLSATEKANTLFGKITIYAPEGTSGAQKMSFPFTFELFADGKIGQTNGVPVQKMPGDPSGIFMPIPKKDGQLITVPYPAGLDMQLPVAMTEKDGAKVFVSTLKEPKTFDKGGTITKYDLSYEYKDNAITKLDLDLNMKVTAAENDQTVTSTMNTKCVLLSKTTASAEDLEKLKKDVSAGIEAWQSLQELSTMAAQPDLAKIDTIIAKLDKYLAEYPDGNFAEAIKEVSSQLKDVLAKMKEQTEAQSKSAADEATTAAK